MILEDGNMKIGVIIQARLSSSRLPNKVLKSLPYGSDVNVLQQVIRRVSNSKIIDEIVVATSTNQEDDEIVNVAKKEGIHFFRGSLENVLDRFYNAALKYHFDVIVRVTSDNPCVDSNVLDKVIKKHLDYNADYTTTALVNHFPIGIGCEVMNFEVLKESYFNATKNYEKEHVTPYIYKSHPEKFKILKYFEEDDYSDIRITLDTIHDYLLMCLIFDELYYDNPFFNLKDILKLFENKPWIREINANIDQKKVCNSLDEELDETIKLCEKQDLNKAINFINANR